MKRFLQVLLFIFCRCLVSGQTVNDSKSFFAGDYNREINRIKKVETITVEYFNRNKLFSKEIFYFDTAGAVTKAISFDSADNIASTWSFVYDTHGKLAGRYELSHVSQKRDTAIYFRWYAGQKLIKDSVGGYGIATDYVYNSKGWLQKKIISISFGYSINRREIAYTCNDAGKMERITETVYQDQAGATGVIYSERVISYDQYGRKTKETELVDASRTPFPVNNGSIGYRYNAQGLLLQQQATRGNAYTYTYTKDGLIASSTMHTDVDGYQTALVDKYQYSFRK